MSTARFMNLTRLIFVTLTLGMVACTSDQSPTDPTVDPSQNLSATATYTLRLLGGNGSDATDMNSAGVVVGVSKVSPSGETHAVRWKNGVMTDLGTLGSGTFSAAFAINPDGVIVGSSQTTSGASRAFRWTNGVMRNLGTLGGRNSEATDINALGVIVGWSETASGARHAFIWKSGKMTDLGTLGGDFAAAQALTRSEVVVGWSFADGENRAFRWVNGVMRDLGTFGGTSSVALGINNAGQVVGLWVVPDDNAPSEEPITEAFLWHRGVKTDLGSGRAVDINPEGVIAGLTEDDDLELTPRGDAWVWENGVRTNLPKPSSGPKSTVAGANAISPDGHVVGFVATNCTQEDRCGPRRAALWRRN